MKIGILTFHRADNLGALLQVYALQKKIEDLGYEAVIIDYRCKTIEDAYVYSVVPKIRKNIIKWFWSLLVVNPKLNEKCDNCAMFRNNYLKITEPVYTEVDRKKIQESFDVVITGSDQIWNENLTGGKDDWYCFKKVEELHTRVISYGASVGNISHFQNVFELYESNLRNYYRISVREKEVGIFLSKELNKDVQKVIDPTMLIEQSTWDELVDKSKYVIKEKYILYYDVEMNSVAMAVAKKIASAKKVKLVHFNESIEMNFRGKYVQQSGPCEFLALIKNAEYIVTSSFHATVFAILFKKKFVTIPHQTTGSRVRCLLEDINLVSRMVCSLNDFSLDTIDKSINYFDVEKKIDLLRKESVTWLKSSLE